MTLCPKIINKKGKTPPPVAFKPKVGRMPKYWSLMSAFLANFYTVISLSYH
jgi:hypothetical protein